MLYEWFEFIDFKNNWVLPFLFMLPVLGFIFFRSSNYLKSSFKVTTAEAFTVHTSRNYFIHIIILLRLFAIGSLILALARPQKSNQQIEKKGEGIDIVLCIDVSGSMLSSDFYPNRLHVAKEMASEFVKLRPVDQIGLVIFSGESYTQYPLSTDHQNLQEQIKALKSGMLEDGTLIGEGLATSVARLAQSKSKSKIIILLTDGKEEPPDTRLIDPQTALQIARAKQVKVYTIGMSAENAVTVREKGSKNNVSVDEGLLRRIALQTGGQYFRARDKESLQLIYQQIDRLEKSKFDVITKTKYEELFIYFIIAALIFITLELVLKYTLLRTFP